VAFADLQSFIQELDRRGQLRRVAAEVDPVLEIAEIADRVSKMPAKAGDRGQGTGDSQQRQEGDEGRGMAGSRAPGAPWTDPIHGGYGGHALLFERVKGSSLPVAINLYGSYERVCLALGCRDLEELAERIEKLVRPELPTTLIEKLKMLPELARLSNMGPKTVRSGVCQEVVETEKADLGSLPIIQCWPGDAGRYITLGSTLTKDPETGEGNLGLYRIQVMGPRRAAMHWQVHHDGARHWRRCAARGEPTPVAVIFGGDPVIAYAASAPLPPSISEMMFAGFVRGGPVEVVACKTVPLEVPATAEIVIEGWVHATEKVTEGPFGDHTGFYSLADEYPLFEVTAITRKRNAIYPTTIVGKPPMEDYYLGKATERVFLPLLKMLMPDVIDYHLPMFGAFHNCAFVKIHKEYPLQARKVIHSIWGAGQMMFSKMVIVVDEDVDVHNEQDVLFHVGANVDPRRDIVIADGPVDVLDHASPYCGAGTKMGIDATRKIAGEGVVRKWPEELVMSQEVRDRVTRRWKEYGIG
jgi:4-hydroxy-3-polyprenylbenzoate decarboxylase